MSRSSAGGVVALILIVLRGGRGQGSAFSLKEILLILFRPGSHSGKAGIHYTAFAPICSLNKLTVVDKCQSQSADFGQLEFTSLEHIVFICHAFSSKKARFCANLLCSELESLVLCV